MMWILLLIQLVLTDGELREIKAKVGESFYNLGDCEKERIRLEKEMKEVSVTPPDKDEIYWFDCQLVKVLHRRES